MNANIKLFSRNYSKRTAPKSDKNRWFTDKDHTTFIKSPTEDLTECLTQLFNGDRNRARIARKAFYPVSLEEFTKYGLYND